MTNTPKDTVEKTNHFLLLFLLIAVAVLVIVFQVSAFFIAFAAILLAVMFYAIAKRLQSRFQISYNAAYGLTMSGLVLLLLLIVSLISASVFSQLDQLTQELPRAYSAIKTKMESIDFLAKMIDYIQQKLQKNGGDFGLTTASALIGGFVSFVVMIILAIYLALQPNLYTQGLQKIIPSGKKKQMKEFLKNSHASLEKWLSGKLLAMVLVSICIFVGLLVLQVKLAFILALLAGLFSFIPNFGPLISAVPAVLLGFAEDSTTGLLVIGLFALVQFLESYILLPLIYQEKVHLPPALTLFLQVLLGTLFGVWGLALAAPLAVVGIVAVDVFRE